MHLERSHFTALSLLFASTVLFFDFIFFSVQKLRSLTSIFDGSVTHFDTCLSIPFAMDYSQGLRLELWLKNEEQRAPFRYCKSALGSDDFYLGFSLASLPNGYTTIKGDCSAKVFGSEVHLSFFNHFYAENLPKLELILSVLPNRLCISTLVGTIVVPTAQSTGWVGAREKVAEAIDVSIESACILSPDAIRCLSLNGVPIFESRPPMGPSCADAKFIHSVDTELDVHTKAEQPHPQMIFEFTESDSSSEESSFSSYYYYYEGSSLIETS